MKIKQTQIDAALQMALVHFDGADIRINTDFRSRWGYTAQFSVQGSKTALEEFELYLATSFVTSHLDNDVRAYALLKSIMDVRELRHEDENGLDETIFYYPQFELDN